MLSNWPIRVKFIVGLILLLLLVLVLSSAGLFAENAYRSLAKNLSWRANELPLAAQLNEEVGNLRITLSEYQGRALEARHFSLCDELPSAWTVFGLRDQFRVQLGAVETTLDRYRLELDERWVMADGTSIADTRAEWETVREIEAALARVHAANRQEDWALESVRVDELRAELDQLQTLTAELPSHLVEKLRGFAPEVRSQYRALLVVTWVAAISTALILTLFLRLFHVWFSRPLGILISGSRRVAGGEFEHRIHLSTNDEMAELAAAMNGMTTRFCAIRDDLDRQVRERTRQVLRNEQLASVGFLAAGVAHEINNPLASIALCAESLESRISEVLDEKESRGDARADNGRDLDQLDGRTSTQGPSPCEVIRNYLEMIQSEAFRCKEITEKLLDFASMGKSTRQSTDLAALVTGVIEMVGHLGKYQRKNVLFETKDPVIARVNPQEMKQVVLNLLTNALDSVDDGGTVHIDVRQGGDTAHLDFIDDGCGMTPEVLQHVFEPFYTKRRSGQGTGLGLSITHRIIADHGGEIEAHSDGPGRGASFRVRIPLPDQQKETDNQNRAA